jgi:hypothetical protein
VIPGIFAELQAFGTMAVFVAAIWGDQIKAKLAPPKLGIRE